MLAVTILGNNSALPMHDRHPTSQVVTTEDELYLVDCGEGTQIQMNRFKIRRSRINHIFISHLHGDHYFGLPGLLNSYSLTNRKEALHLHAPSALKDILDLQFKAAEARLTFDIHFHPLEEGSLLLDNRKMTIECFQVRHRIPCWGFLFREKSKPRKVDPDRARQMGIPSAFFSRLKEGMDFQRPDGQLVPNDWATKPPPPSFSYAYCADTLYDEQLADVVRSCDLIYHEATYLDELRERAEERFHSTAKQAAQLAEKGAVRRLLLGHFSSKYEDLEVFRREAMEVFPATDLAREGTTYLVGH